MYAEKHTNPKCAAQWTNPCNQIKKQNIVNSSEFPSWPVPITGPSAPKKDHYSDFSYHRLVLSILGVYISESHLLYSFPYYFVRVIHPSITVDEAIILLALLYGFTLWKYTTIYLFNCCEHLSCFQFWLLWIVLL